MHKREAVAPAVERDVVPAVPADPGNGKSIPPRPSPAPSSGKVDAAPKLHCRERLRLLLDEGSLIEDGALANSATPGYPADGVVTGIGRIRGRPVAVMANDSAVKAGSWGPLTVEKILRIQETAERLRIPLLYLVDSAGARINVQTQMFPGRRHAGRIFHNQVRLSGLVPQICLLFGPSAAGGAYIPAFSDIVIMVEGKASMYLGSPRMAEMVIGERTTLEEMGGARMHCTQSGCGDVLVRSEEAAITFAREYLGFMPQHCFEDPPPAVPRSSHAGARPIRQIIPEHQAQPFDMRQVIDALVDAGSFLELKALWAGELITGFGRIDGRVVGIVASQPKVKGGVLFVDSADKGTRFVWLCDAFRIPLLFLADVPGFMIGSKVERQGIIRHGAKFISAVSSATVPKISVVLRKAYGAGLYAMCGPGFEPDCCLALPTASIAVMGPEAAVNAVYYRKIQQIPEDRRKEEVERMREEYRDEIDIRGLASDLHVDAIIEPETLRSELVRRFALYRTRNTPPPEKRRSVTPV